MMRPMLSIAALAMTGCVFTNVGKDLEQTSCVGEESEFCGDLNTLSPTGDACQEWSCDQADGVCKVLPRDSDGDGAPAMECAPADVEPDCDDNDANRTPGTTERCDGVDNNCDGVIDEGAYVKEEPVVLLADESITYFSVAQNPETLEPTFLYRDEQGEAVVAQVGSASRELGINAQGTALQHLAGTGMVAVIGQGDGAVRPLNLGTASGTFGGEHIVADTQKASSVAFVYDDANAFVGSYIEHNPNNDSCGGLTSSTRHLFRGIGTTVEETLSVGGVADPSAAAVLSTSAGWFVAHTDDLKTIRIHQVDLDGPMELGDLEYNKTTILEPGELVLAKSDDSTQVAMAYRDGCLNETSLYLVLFTQVNGKLTIGTTLKLPSENQGRRPKLLWRTSPSPGWIVSWEEQNKTAKLAWVSAAGELLGTPYELLTSPGMLEGVHITKGEGDDLLLYIPSNKGLEQVRLACDLDG